MNRTRRIATLLAVAAITTSCGSPTPAERAFLDEIQARGSEITLSDPDGKLMAGHAVCDELGKTKPDERSYLVYGFKRSPQFGYLVTGAAVSKLCPELGVSYLG